MEKNFADLIKKKLEEQKKNPADPKKLEAKAAMIKELMDTMKGGMADEIKHAKGMKKVTVASNSPEGLEAGLDKAKELVEGEEESSSEDLHDLEESSESEMKEASESPADEKSEDEKLSTVEKQLEDLKNKKKSLLSSVY